MFSNASKMKNFFVKNFFCALFIGLTSIFALHAQNNVISQGNRIEQTTVIARIRMTFQNQEIKIGLFDTPASQQLLAQLPLTLSFSDFAQTEKIAYLPKKLTTHNTPSASQAKGNFTYYAPWGNLALFYKGYGHANDLYVLGQIESGQEKLEAIKQNFMAVIEKIE